MASRSRYFYIPFRSLEPLCLNSISRSIDNYNNIVYDVTVEFPKSECRLFPECYYDEEFSKNRKKVLRCGLCGCGSISPKRRCRICQLKSVGVPGATSGSALSISGVGSGILVLTTRRTTRQSSTMNQRQVTIRSSRSITTRCAMVQQLNPLRSKP